MEVKKSKGATLENQKPVYIQIGMIMVLSAILIALEWTKTDVRVSFEPGKIEVPFAIDIIPVTTQPDQPSPPPPKATDFKIVDDGTVDDFIQAVIESELNDESRIEDFIPKIPVIDEIRDEPDFVYIPDEMPEFPGGNDALMRYLNSSIKYPAIAIENRISGKVYVNFIIDKNGEVTNVTVARGVDPSLDREAVRVVQSMPAWKPGKQRNKPVRVFYTVPINFVLKEK